MSDTRTTPSSVERMSSTSRGFGGSGSAGFGGMLTVLLVVACIALLAACFVIHSGKKDVQDQLAAAKTELGDAKSALVAKDNQLQAKDMKITQMAGDLARCIPLFRLPAGARADTVNEAISKIQQLCDMSRPDSGHAGGTFPAPANDSPAAWMETIARQVAKGAINTKEPAGNDAAKLQMHKGIQIVLNKIGAYPRPPTGSSQDTYDAVVAFQKANKLTADGIIGKGTWGKVRERMESVAHAGN